MNWRRLQIGISWLLFVGWAAGVTWLSSLPGSALPRIRVPMPHFDKVVHWFIFFVGALCLMLALRVSWPEKRRRWAAWFTMVVLSIFGFANEWQQLWTPGRTGGSLGDVAANTVGVLTGCLFCLLLQGGWKRWQNSRDPQRDRCSSR